MSIKAVSPEEIYGGGTERVLPLYRQLSHWHRENFQHQAERYYRAPGRVELGGNHTDHQGGVTLSAAVDLDMVAGVSRRQDDQIILCSQNYPLIQISLGDTFCRETEKGSTVALLRGMLAGFQKKGLLPRQEGGLDISVISRVPTGSGLSSSAALEILLGTIFNDYYGDGTLSTQALAVLGRDAENTYFGKPCGLLDQLSCAQGGIISVDFSRQEPWIRRLEGRFPGGDEGLYMVLCGTGHENLTEEYAAIPRDCHRVAAYFGQTRLSSVPESDFWSALPGLRRELGDRAVLRAVHVYEENRRALAQAMCLLKGNWAGFLQLVRESGRSSAMYLQNVVINGEIMHQEMLLTMALCENILRGKGAVRVHGGGFGGTVEAFVPRDKATEFKERLENLLGPGCVLPLSISPLGGTGVAWT